MRKRGLENLYQWHREQFLKLSEGPTSSYNSEGAHTVPGSRPPKAAGLDLAYLDANWKRCETNQARREVIERAQELLRDYLFPKPKPDSSIYGTEEYRRAIALEERPARIVAHVWGITKRQVYEYRKEFVAERTAAAL